MSPHLSIEVPSLCQIYATRTHQTFLKPKTQIKRRTQSAITCRCTSVLCASKTLRGPCGRSTRSNSIRDDRNAAPPRRRRRQRSHRRHRTAAVVRPPRELQCPDRIQALGTFRFIFFFFSFFLFSFKFYSFHPHPHRKLINQNFIFSTGAGARGQSEADSK